MPGHICFEIDRTTNDGPPSSPIRHLSRRPPPDWMNLGMTIMTDRIGVDELYAHGVEWLACDRDGHLAWFESIALIPVPETILRSDSDRKRCIDFVERLPIIGDAIFREEIRGMIRGFGGYGGGSSRGVQLGKRGVFVYIIIDEGRKNARYERMFSPGNPVHLSSLPEEIQAMIAPTAMPRRFANLQQIPFSVVKDMDRKFSF